MTYSDDFVTTARVVGTCDHGLSQVPITANEQGMLTMWAMKDFVSQENP